MTLLGLFGALIVIQRPGNYVPLRYAPGYDPTLNTNPCQSFFLATFSRFTHQLHRQFGVGFVSEYENNCTLIEVPMKAIYFLLQTSVKLVSVISELVWLL